MTTEEYYQACQRDGEPMLQRRLCRYDLETQLRAAIEIAIAFSEGKAGYRNQGKSYIGETTWYVSGWTPEGDVPRLRDTVWWMIPYRIDKRIMALYEAARDTVMCADGGKATAERITETLKKWKETNQWRAIVAELFPKRGDGVPQYKTKKRRANRIATLRETVAARPKQQSIAKAEREPTWIEKQVGFCVGDEVYVSGDLSQKIRPNSGICVGLDGRFAIVETQRGERKVLASSCQLMTPELRRYLAELPG